MQPNDHRPVSGDDAAPDVPAGAGRVWMAPPVASGGASAGPFVDLGYLTGGDGIAYAAGGFVVVDTTTSPTAAGEAVVQVAGAAERLRQFGNELAALIRAANESGFCPGGARTPRTLEVTEPARVAGRTPGQVSTPAMVDAIDAAVDGKCGCGCGVTLTLDGPSAYFASAACQWRWTNRTQVDNPREVYDGVDAHATLFAGRADNLYRTTTTETVFVPQESLRPLRRCGACNSVFYDGHHDGHHEGHCPACQDVIRVTLGGNWWENPSLHVRTVGYRRWCRCCEKFCFPELVLNEHAAETFGVADLVLADDWGCPTCRTLFDMPVAATLYFTADPPGYQFRITDRTGRVAAAHVDYTEVRDRADPRAAADRIWSRLERELAAARPEARP